MTKDILGRYIVEGDTAWMLKEMGFKGWVSGYYHEPCNDDNYEYYDYECIGNASGFVNENSLYRASAPTLIEAFSFLLECGYSITIRTSAPERSLVNSEWNSDHYVAT